MSVGRHANYLLPDSELAKAREPVRRGSEDLAGLVRAMLADAVLDNQDAKDPIELSRLAGLSLSRVSSALAAGESRGLFQRHPAPARMGTETPSTRWRLSPGLADLASKFANFAEASSRFSREVTEAASLHPPKDAARNVEFNLEVAKTVFSKWSVDILTLIYANKALGFQEIAHAMPGMSSRVLSLKLARLQELGLIHREVLQTKPPRVQYSFTEKGLRVAKLGEPVFLYLRFAEGLLFLEDDSEAAVR